MSDEETNRLLNEMLQALNRSGGRQDDPNVKKANKAYEDHIRLQNKSNDLEKKNQTTVSKGLIQADKAAKASMRLMNSVERASTALRENREQFSSLDSSIELAGQGFKLAGKAAGLAITGLGALGGLLPGVGKSIAGFGSELGKLAAGVAEIVADVAVAVMKQFTKELDRINGAFRTVAQTGALGAEGMSGLAKQAINAGLSFNQFAKVVSKESQGLAFAFSTTGKAAQGLSDTTKAMRPFREQLLTLGIGVEQQNELAAKYIVRQQRLRRGEIRDSQALAQGSQEYAKSLVTLSKITGQSIDATEKQREALLADTRKGAALREIERTTGKDAFLVAEKVIGTLQGIPQLKDFGTGLADALGGAGTDAAVEFMKSAGAIGPQVVAQLKSGSIGVQQALDLLQKGAVTTFKGIGGDATAAVASQTGTAAESIFQFGQAFSQIKNLGEAYSTAQKNTNKLMGTQDGLTKDVVAAQQAMIRAATELDNLALQTILPAAGSAVKGFTDVLAQTTIGLAKHLKVLKEEGGQGFLDSIAKDVNTAGKQIDEATGGFFSGIKDYIDNNIGTAQGIGTGGLVGGGAGALIGSLVGPAGTVIGAKIGATLGLYLGNMFSSKSSPLAGGLAEGGSAQAGKDYLVGENGPEILKMGKTSGVVIPGQVGPGVPGRTPGTFDVKLGDGTKVTVDAKGNELGRTTPTIGGLSMSSFADGSTSMKKQTTIGDGVNLTQDYVNGQMAGQRTDSGNLSTYTSEGGVNSVNYKMGDGVKVGAQGAASGGKFDALSQLRSTAGPSGGIGNAGGLSISNQGLNDMEGGPAAGQTQTIQGDGGSNEKLLAVMEAMLEQNQKAVRLQDEQLQATRNN